MTNLDHTTPDDEQHNPSPPIITPTLFTLFQCDHPDTPPSRHALSGIDVVQFGRDTTRTTHRRLHAGTWQLNISIPDPWLSTRHARLTRGIDHWLLEDGPSRNGTFVNGHRIQRTLLKDGDILELGHTFFSFRLLSLDKHDDLDDLTPPPLPELGTLIPDIQRQYARLALTAESTLSILLAGETGTGKEKLARAIHHLSGRTGPFMAINCGALASSVLESELFGVKKGAFTGADTDRDGLIRTANGGTLFLDEIGELPLASQATLLRVLQEREVIPVGGTQPIKVDFRLVSATNRDLSAQVAKDVFRADLLSRISGFGIRVPALRHRREDLTLLIPALLARHAKRPTTPQHFTPQAIRALLTHDWPMNIRELEKCLEAAAVLARGGPIDLDDLPESLQCELSIVEESEEEALTPSPPPASTRTPTAREAKLRETITGLLRAHHGNVSEVARVMGKGRTHIRRWIKRLDLDPDTFRTF